MVSVASSRPGSSPSFRRWPTCRADLLSADRCGSGMHSRLARFEQLLHIEQPEELDQFCHHPGPSGLMARAQARSVIPVEVFVEQDVVTPVRIDLELFGAAVHGTPYTRVAQEDPR